MRAKWLKMRSKNVMSFSIAPRPKTRKLLLLYLFNNVIVLLFREISAKGRFPGEKGNMLTHCME